MELNNISLKDLFSVYNSISSDAILVSDKNGSIVNINNSLLNMFEYSENELLGEKIEILLPDSFKKSHIAHRDKAIKATNLERKMGNDDKSLKGRKKDGTLFHIDISLKSFVHKGDKYMLCGIRNINYLKNLNEKYINAKNIAEDFLASMSHEMRTPLTAIICQIELLKQTEEIKIIKHNSEHLYNLLNNILDLASLNAGMSHIRESDFNINNSLKEISNMLKSQEKSKNIKMLNDYDKQIRIITTDNQKFKQIILNLLNNAVKYTPDNGIITIHSKMISTTNSKIRFKVDIIDNGPGISLKNQEKLFHDFERLDNEDVTKVEGTGIGLVIVKKFCKLLNAEITLKSKLGEGSTFSILFNLKRTFRIRRNSIDRNRRLSDHRISCNIFEKNSLKILLAEDTPILQKLVKQIIIKCGFTNIDVVSNGKEAVDYCKNNDVDVIFMDWQMPVMQGNEACKEIRSLTLKKQPKIIFLTGNAFDSYQKEAQEVGGDAFYTKPIKPRDITESINLFFNIEKHRDSIASSSTDDSKLSPKIKLFPEDNTLTLDDISFEKDKKKKKRYGIKKFKSFFRKLKL